MKLERPYEICHMITSLNGKTSGTFLEANEFETYMDEYERIHDEYNVNAWLVGRISMAQHYGRHEPIDLLNQLSAVNNRDDFVANYDGNGFAIAIDSAGKLFWDSSSIEYKSTKGYQKHHIIQIITKTVFDAYLSYLQDLGIAYLFGGDESIDLDTVLKKLKLHFNIHRLLLEGGAKINGSFYKEVLINEISLLTALSLTKAITRQHLSLLITHLLQPFISNRRKASARFRMVNV